MADFGLLGYSPIGILHSCFREKYGTPRQPALVPMSKGQIELSASEDTENLVSRLIDSNASHVWILFIFDLNNNKAMNHGGSTSRHVKAKIRPPRLDGERVGVFSTRSPHRPNPIGLSLVKLDRVQIPKEAVRHPPWVGELDEKAMEVSILPKAQEELDLCCACSDALQFYSSAEEMKELILQNLSWDQRTLHSKRKHGAEGIYGCALDNLDVSYWVRDRCVIVVDVALVRHHKIVHIQDTVDALSEAELCKAGEAQSVCDMITQRPRLRTAEWYNLIYSKLQALGLIEST